MREGRKSELVFLAGEKCHSYRIVSKHDSCAKN